MKFSDVFLEALSGCGGFLLRITFRYFYLSASVLLSLKSLSVSCFSNASFDKRVWKKQLDPIIKLWNNLCQNLKHSTIMPNSDALPVESFIVLEIQKCEELVTFLNLNHFWEAHTFALYAFLHKGKISSLDFCKKLTNCVIRLRAQNS